MSACYADLSPDGQYPDYTFTISKENCEDFAWCVNHGPVTITRNDGTTKTLEPVALNHVSPFQLNNFLVMRAAFVMPDGILHAKEKLSNHAIVRPGDPLKMDLKVTERYIKREKKYLEFKMDVFNENDGNKVLEIERTAVWPC